MDKKMCPILAHGVMGVATATSISATLSPGGDEPPQQVVDGLAEQMICKGEDCQLWWLCSGKMIQEVSPSRESVEVRLVRDG